MSEPTPEQKARQLFAALAIIYLDPDIGDRARVLTKDIAVSVPEDLAEAIERGIDHTALCDAWSDTNGSDCTCGVEIVRRLAAAEVSSRPDVDDAARAIVREGFDALAERAWSGSSRPVPDTEDDREEMRRTVGMVMAERLPDGDPDDETFDSIRDEIVSLLIDKGFSRRTVPDERQFSETSAMRYHEMTPAEVIAEAEYESHTRDPQGRPVPDTEDDSVIDELAHAIRLTVEYVGTETLPPIEGWSWFDALKKHRPDLLTGFFHRPAPSQTPERAETEDDLAPWFRVDGCFGHCDREGWFAPCRRTSREAALAKLDEIEEYAEAHGHPSFQDEGSAFLSGWSAALEAAARVGTTPEQGSE